MKQISLVFNAVLAVATVTLLGCAKVDRYQNWSKTTGEITSIKAIEDEESSVANTKNYQVKFVFKVDGVDYTCVQKTSELKANLISEGQDIEVRVNPEDAEKSEIVVPAPYPDKSGMQWRRMPKSLTTKSKELESSNWTESFPKSN